MVDNFDKILNIIDVDNYADGFMTIRLISRNKDLIMVQKIQNFIGDLSLDLRKNLKINEMK